MTARAETQRSIPDKRYFSIGEVGDLCGIKPHVLRYWEQEFTQLSPAKRRGNRRYYRRADIELICRIKNLLYEQGFTIQGARQQLAEQPAGGPTEAVVARDALAEVRAELESILQALESRR